MARPLKVNDRGRPAGQAVVVEIRRHSHRKADAARKDEAGPDTAPATGVDYLRLLRDDHVARIAARGIDYTTLAADAPPDAADSPAAGARPAADADAEEDR